jgi:phosphoribosyl-AMP cyclohydrolase
MDAETLIGRVRFNADGLVPCVVQDAGTCEVLMVAWANETALREMFRLGETVFWSRSRQELWHKGATSGNTQRVVQAGLDCDADTLLLKVECAGPACHTGEVSCFRDAACGDAVWARGPSA